jgi:hypothetical protein
VPLTWDGSSPIVHAPPVPSSASRLSLAALLEIHESSGTPSTHAPSSGGRGARGSSKQAIRTHKLLSCHAMHQPPS